MYLEDRVVETGFSFSSEVPQPPERRGAERHIKILRVGTLVVDGRRELCLIRNISAGGVMAHVYILLRSRPARLGRTEDQPAGDRPGRLDARRQCRHPVRHAPWTSPSCSPIRRVLDNGWRPRTPRVEIDRMATLRTGARTSWVHARDISQSGVKIETDATPPAAGEEVVITLEGLRPRHGVVRWQSGDQCGIAFNQLIPFGELIEWLKQDGDRAA